MDYQVLMRVLNGHARGTKKLEALGNVEAVGVAVDVNRLSLDIFHDGVRQPVVRGAAIEQARDIWMVQPGNNFALLTEPPVQIWKTLLGSENLQGDLL